MQKIAILLLISVFSISVLSAGEKSMDFYEIYVGILSSQKNRRESEKGKFFIKI